ncbi:MAG: hypothetical protein AAB251_04565, partial [Deltaproteobacteria bacterium]
CGIESLNLCKMGKLTFMEPDEKRFPALRLAYQAINAGGFMPAVLNAADEIAVEAFLQREIAFTDITEVVRATMEGFEKGQGARGKGQGHPSLKEILESDRQAREIAKEMVAKKQVYTG